MTGMLFHIFGAAAPTAQAAVSQLLKCFIVYKILQEYRLQKPRVEVGRA